MSHLCSFMIIHVASQTRAIRVDMKMMPSRARAREEKGKYILHSLHLT